MRATCLALLLLAAPLLGRESRAAVPSAQASDDEAGTEASRPTAAGAPRAEEKGKSKGKGKGKGTGEGTGNGKRPVMARRAPRSGPATPAAHLVRSGFRMTETGSEVVIQTSAEVELETRGTRFSPTFVLKRCRAVRANDRRPLDTRFFGTSVTGVALRQRGGDLIVRVTLKDAATTTTRKEPGPGESWNWILAFATPSGGRAPASPPSSVPTATAAALP